MRVMLSFTLLRVLMRFVQPVFAPRLGEERCGLYVSRVSCMRYFPSLFLPFSVRSWLRFVIVALPGLFIYFYKEVSE